MKRRVVAATMLIAAPLLVLLTFVACLPFIPAEIRSGYAWLPGLAEPVPPVVVLVPALVFSIPCSVIGSIRILKGSDDPRRNTITGALQLMSWMSALFAIAAFVSAIGAADYDAVKGRWWMPLIPLFGLIAVGAVGWRVMPRPDVDQGRFPVPTSELALRPGEMVAWESATRCGPSKIFWAVQGGIALVLAFWWWPGVLLISALGVFMWLDSPVRILLDQRGVSVSRRFGRMRSLAPLGAIEYVRATSVRAVEVWWSFDFRDQRRLFRSPGPVLEIQLVDDELIRIGVTDAEVAADVVNALLARLRAQVHTA